MSDVKACVETNNGLVDDVMCDRCFFFICNRFLASNCASRNENLVFCDERRGLVSCKYSLGEFLRLFSGYYVNRRDFNAFRNQVSQLFGKTLAECEFLWCEVNKTR